MSPRSSGSRERAKQNMEKQHSIDHFVSRAKLDIFFFALHLGRKMHVKREARCRRRFFAERRIMMLISLGFVNSPRMSLRPIA